MVPLAARAVTVMVPATPAVVDEGKPVTLNVLTGAAAGLTVMPAWVPVMLPVVVSVAVSDCVPVVFSVALKVCAPLSAAVKV